MELSVYGSVVVSLVVGLLIGFLLGRGLSKSTQKSKLSQKILPNELERWRLQSKYATLLMEKKPMLKAKEMLGLVKAQIQENESEIQEVDEKVNQAAEEVTQSVHTRLIWENSARERSAQPWRDQDTPMHTDVSRAGNMWDIDLRNKGLGQDATTHLWHEARDPLSEGSATPRRSR